MTTSKSTYPPLIPEKLRRVDESTVSDHFSLSIDDSCFYIWEYTAGRRYDFSPANQLISNLKIKPGALALAPARLPHKQRAIAHAALALRQLMGQSFVEELATFVPVPGSKCTRDPEYDNRLVDVLQQAFHGWEADLRVMLELTHSTAADHESADRLSYEELRAMTRLTHEALLPCRRIIVIVDDVLNSGKHFRVAAARISTVFPAAVIRGLFLARCIREIPPRDPEFGAIGRL